MFPETFPYPNDPRRQGERRVFEAVRDQLASQWTAFYAVPWLTIHKGVPADGETDFVLAHPLHGLFIAEVKGGGIEYDARKAQWYSIDRTQTRHAIRDPFDQARVGARILDEKLGAQSRWIGTDVHAGRMVVFPDATVAGNIRPDGLRDIIIDARDLGNLRERIVQIVELWQPAGGWRTPLGAARIQALESLLARSFELRLSLAEAIRETDRKIFELTDQQSHILGLLQNFPRACVTGGAGTGKTLLAVEKARQLAKAGHRTLLCCFNRPLAEFLQQQTASVPNLVVDTFHALCERAAQETGVELPERDADGQWSSEVFATALPDALLGAIDRGFEPFDAIVLDEAQDFVEEWLMHLIFTLRDAKQGAFYVFGDPAQTVYKRRTGFIDGIPVFPLTRNLRNTRHIHGAAAPHSPSPTEAVGPEGPPVEWITTTPDGIPSAVRDAVTRLIREEGLTTSDIAVLTLRRNTIPESTQHLGPFPVRFRADVPHAIRIDTVHRFKGLERAAIVLALPPDIDKARHQALLYVGMTRARGHLVVIGTEGALRVARDEA
jgi:hypothetical protein